MKNNLSAAITSVIPVMGLFGFGAAMFSLYIAIIKLYNMLSRLKESVRI